MRKETFAPAEDLETGHIWRLLAGYPDSGCAPYNLDYLLPAITNAALLDLDPFDTRLDFSALAH